VREVVSAVEEAVEIAAVLGWWPPNAAVVQLSRERVDTGRDVFRLAARQCRVHPGVWIENRERECHALPATEKRF
jgi:hypothetical protein